MESIHALYEDNSFTKDFIEREKEFPSSLIFIYSTFVTVPDNLQDCLLKNISGNNSFLIVRPLFMTKWYRYGDTIDYIEAEMDKTYERIEILNDNPYPYNGLIAWDKRSQQTIDSPWVKKALYQRELLLYCFEELGFKSHEEAIENFAPAIPEEMLRQCEAMKIFSSIEGTPSYYDLVPMYVQCLS
jgi:hypothetical protein